MKGRFFIGENAFIDLLEKQIYSNNKPFLIVVVLHETCELSLPAWSRDISRFSNRFFPSWPKITANT